MSEKELRIQVLSAIYKRSEKLGIDSADFCKEENLVFQSQNQQSRIFESLERSGYITGIFFEGGGCYITSITSSGIDYIEQQNTEPRVYTNSSNMKLKKYDVFVSHATADKESFVDTLVDDLHRLTDDVWYDRKKLKWGNNIKNKIFEGLEHSEFGIIVFSKSFIGRDWTETELQRLLHTQNESGRDVVLPILLNDLSAEEFVATYPGLKDVMFIKQSEHTIQEISILFAERLIERLKNK